MAGTARRWVLPSMLLVTLLLSLNEWPSTTYQSNSGSNVLWWCSECDWVEEWPKGKAPFCSGPGSHPHPEAVLTVRVSGGGYRANKGPPRFFR